ncbi:hypothetical protein JST97_26080 [bacterium]|nr:hypothetical protein [bacterium]
MTIVVRNDSPPKDDGLPLVAALIWALGGLCSVIACFVMLTSAPRGVQVGGFPWFGVGLHLTGSVLAYFGARVAKGSHPSSAGWALLVAFFAFFGGPLGFLAGVACYLFGVGQPTEMPLVDVVKAEMFVRTTAHHKSDHAGAFDVQLREELRTQPIVDLLPYADVATAIAIINKLADQRKRGDLIMLRELSQDRRPEVYQFALSRLDEFERDYATRIYQLKEQLAFRHDDVGLRVELAKVYYDYTNSGLLDDSLEDYYWEMTLAQLFEAMRFEPNRQDLVVDMARLFLMRQMYREAEAAVEDVLRKEPANLDAQLLYLECLTERAQIEGDPGLLQQARKRALESAWAVKLPKSQEQHPLFKVAQFWFGRGRASEKAAPNA